MGAFCTRTICNVEKGDENYNKLLNRNINMDKKKPEFESLPSRDVPDNDEQEVAMTPTSPNEQPKPAYTHSTPNSSMTITATSQSQQSVEISQSSLNSPSDNYSTDVNHPSAVGGHVQIPTPSIQEIQAAMDNMSAMFTPTTTADGIKETETAMASNTYSPPREHVTLPTMADNVSNLHLKLANPFASSLANDNTPSTYSPAMPSIPSHQSIPSGQEINAGMPISPTKITENISTISESMLGGDPSSRNVAITPPNNNNDIAEPAPIEPTIENIFGAQDNSTIIIHGDENESAARKLSLQLEGSSDHRDDTNVVFSPPNISNDKVEEEQEHEHEHEQEQVQEDQQQSQQDMINKIDNESDNVQTEKKVADEKNVPKSETLPSIPKMEVSDDRNSDDIDNETDIVNDNDNDNDNENTNNNTNDNVMNDIDNKAEIKEETVTESRDDNVSNDRDEDKNEEAPKQYLINIENVEEHDETQQEEEQVQEQGQEEAQEEEQAAAVLANVNSSASNATVKIINERLSATNSNQSEQNEIKQTEKRIDRNQQGMGLMTDPWKSDYETSDLESCDSLDKGEMNDNDNDNNNDNNNNEAEQDGDGNGNGNGNGKQRRASKSQSLAAHHHLALNYEDTTLNDESTTDEEDSPQPGDHSKLYREHSRWKWQAKDINKQTKAMNKQLKKLKAEQEVAEMHNMMQFYRQQSEQLQ